VESSCEFGIEHSGSIKCWESYLVASRLVLSSIELVRRIHEVTPVLRNILQVHIKSRTFWVICGDSEE
jgi:hypothetical protein